MPRVSTSLHLADVWTAGDFASHLSKDCFPKDGSYAVGWTNYAKDWIFGGDNTFLGDDRPTSRGDNPVPCVHRLTITQIIRQIFISKRYNWTKWWWVMTWNIIGLIIFCLNSSPLGLIIKWVVFLLVSILMAWNMPCPATRAFRNWFWVVKDFEIH